MPNLFNHPVARPVSLCGRSLEQAAHVCAFFDSSQQEYDCLGPFVAEGLAQGEQVVSIRDAGKCNDHIDRLRGLVSTPLEAPIARNQLRVVASEETYLQDGHFEADRMFTLVESILRDAREGFPRVRAFGEMSWALQNLPGTGELMEYESKLNVLTQEHDCTILCVYDVNRFSGKAVMDVLATHPLVIMGDRLYENPYFVEPQVYLQELLRRGSTPLAREAALDKA